jgi:hypothetical protein
VPVMLIPPEGFLVVFLAILGRLGSIGAFCLQGQVLEALALGPAEGSSEELALGSWADIEMAGIGMSNPNQEWAK